MRKALTFMAVVALASAALFAQETAPKPQPSRHIDALAWLVGGVWTADASKMGGGMQRIETRYTWSDNNAYVRFNTHFITDKATMRTYDGQFFWNPDQSTLAMWYMDSRNAIIAGPVQIDGDVTHLLFRATDFEGKMADLRVNVTRKTNDQYTWSLEEKKGDAWAPLASLDYLRSTEK
jgi:hypothetical protein